MAICQKEYLISSNDDYALRFSFDERWKKEKHKKARLLFDGRYIDVPIKNGTAVLPKIPPAEALNVGVYSKHRATTYADLGCIRSCKDARQQKGEQLV